MATAPRKPQPEPRIVPLPGVPGIQRDGTDLETDRWSDGSWVRFNNRGNPRKMGGFRRMTDSLAGISRGVWVGANDLDLFVHSGSPSHLELTTYNSSTGVASGPIVDRTPVGFVADVNMSWTFDQMFNPGGTNSVVFAHAAYNTTDISASRAGTIYYGDAYNQGIGAGPFVPIGTTDPHDSGGILAMHPFLFSFGNFGTVNWSSAADPLSVGTSNARITEQKIVAGLAMRGGSGASPAGLLWSLNALVRVTYVGGSAQFDFDTISDRISMLSARGVVELDGTFFWAGMGRFMKYSGVIQECANNVNVDDFFDNINMEHRQKVWATVVPQWGEVWWFYPRGNGVEECNHAVVYNKRLSESLGRPVWYDTELPLEGFRTAGRRPEVFPYPVWAGLPFAGSPGYALYQHELGTDALYGTPFPIPSRIRTCNISLAINSEDTNVRLLRVEPDIIQSGNLTVTRRARAYPRRGPVEKSVILTPDADKIDDLRGQGRLMTLEVSSNDLGGHYEFGRNLIHIAPGDKRPVDA